MTKLLIYLFIILSFSSCYAYKIYPKEDRHFTCAGERKKLFVINPELKKEYSILKWSGIFQITNDSTGADIMIRLFSLRRNFVCGNAIMGGVITLGQMPVHFPDIYDFSFEEFSDRGKIEWSYQLKIVKRYWFWDMFTFDKNLKKKAGKALLVAYFKE